MVAPPVNRSIAPSHPSINAEQKAVQAASVTFYDFCMTRQGIEANLPALVAHAQPSSLSSSRSIVGTRHKGQCAGSLPVFLSQGSGRIRGVFKFIQSLSWSGPSAFVLDVLVLSCRNITHK